MQQQFGLVMLDTFADRYKRSPGHQFAYRLVRIVRETHVTVGQDADQLAAALGDNWNAGDFILIHQAQRIRQRFVRRNRDRIDDHA